MVNIDNRRNVLTLAIFIIFLSILFLIYNRYKVMATFNGSPEWSSELILTFNGHEYNLTDEITTDVGNKIGTITYHGKINNSFSFYAIKSSKNNDRIAVKTKKGFLTATIKS